MNRSSLKKTGTTIFGRSLAIIFILSASACILILANPLNSSDESPAKAPAVTDVVKPSANSSQPVEFASLVSDEAQTSSSILVEEPIIQASFCSNNQQTLHYQLSLLEQGYEKLLATPEYTAHFFKQERIGGKLQASQEMRIKLRHEPFSVYLKWLVGDVDKEVLFVNGSYDDKLIVKFGGWKARVIPTMKLDPDGSLVKRDSRYPIQKIGLLSLLEKLIKYYRYDLENDLDFSCTIADCDSDLDLNYHCFTVEYDSPQDYHDYRKTITHIDKELLLPICIRNFTWPDDEEYSTEDLLDNATLVEHYSYSNISTNPVLSDADFEITNQNYNFQK